MVNATTGWVEPRGVEALEGRFLGEWGVDFAEAVGGLLFVLLWVHVIYT